MRQGGIKRVVKTLASATTSALVLLLTVVFPASADHYMVQKKQESKEHGGKTENPPVHPQVESIIRTWSAEGKLRQDYGDPATFIHIVRLDRRPGELISYLINLGTGHFGNTYWTFCRPFTLQPGSGDQRKAGAGVKDNGPPVSTGPHEGLTVTDTGETKLINNFQCRKYLLEGKLSSTEFSSEIWTSMDVASVLERYGLVWGVRLDRADSDLRFRGDSSGMPEEMRTIKGFPVLITEIEKNQYVHYERRLELLEFKEDSLPANHFDLPKGLTKKYRGAMAHPPECED